MTNWVYVRSEPGLWAVGFYDLDGKWHPDSDFDSSKVAAERAHYLNGGVNGLQERVTELEKQLRIEQKAMNSLLKGST